MRRDTEFLDALHAAHDLTKKHDGLGIVGFGVAELRDGDGQRKLLQPFSNLITDAGDLYYATKAIVGISPSATAAPTAVSGMQVGTGTTAVAKSSTGAAIVTFTAGQAFDSTYPKVANLGAGLGVNAVYLTTYGAGVATATIAEATIVTGTVTAAAAASATIARVTFTGIAKGANDTLAFTWNHKFLGA
jgi:hypothetical protein